MEIKEDRVKMVQNIIILHTKMNNSMLDYSRFLVVVYMRIIIELIYGGNI